eukprot:659164-Rhodomonas_salina.1
MVLPEKQQAGLQQRVCAPISLRGCYAKSGTEIAYGFIGLRTCYAMSGADLPYAATRHRPTSLSRTTSPLWRAFATRCPSRAWNGNGSGTWGYISPSGALSSYALATRWPVLTRAMLLPGRGYRRAGTVGHTRVHRLGPLVGAAGTKPRLGSYARARRMLVPVARVRMWYASGRSVWLGPGMPLRRCYAMPSTVCLDSV